MKYIFILCVVFLWSCDTQYNRQAALYEYGQFVKDSINEVNKDVELQEYQQYIKDSINEVNIKTESIKKIKTEKKKKKSSWINDISIKYEAEYKVFKKERINIRLRNNSKFQNYAYIQIEVVFKNSKGYIIDKKQKTFNDVLLSQNAKNVHFDTKFPKDAKEYFVYIIDAREYKFN
jgi:hypothetical protein